MRRLGYLCAAAALALTAISCGSDEPAGPSDRDLLEAIMEGDPSDAELEAKLATADLLCTVDPELLNVIWADLDSTQFEFQEFVFQHRCPKDGQRAPYSSFERPRSEPRRRRRPPPLGPAGPRHGSPHGPRVGPPPRPPQKDPETSDRNARSTGTTIASYVRRAQASGISGDAAEGRRSSQRLRQIAKRLQRPEARQPAQASGIKEVACEACRAR